LGLVIRPAGYSGCQKNVAVFKRFFLQPYNRATVYTAIPQLGVFKPGALHPVTPAPIKALPCLCFFQPIAEKSKPPALRVVGDSEHYYEKRYKRIFPWVEKMWKYRPSAILPLD